jgi:hypothetical protein
VRLQTEDVIRTEFFRNRLQRSIQTLPFSLKMWLCISDQNGSYKLNPASKMTSADSLIRPRIPCHGGLPVRPFPTTRMLKIHPSCAVVPRSSSNKPGAFACSISSANRIGINRRSEDGLRSSQEIISRPPYAFCDQARFCDQAQCKQARCKFLRWIFLGL